jgi:preprotein translocase subunit SecD
LTEEAAKRHADITSKLGISPENPEYLSEKLDLYVDNALTDSLWISKDLKGQATTQITIQGSGSGSNRAEALKDAEINMKKLQTILITGSLPYKLEIVKLDTISPSLGKQFAKNLFLLGLIVFAIISIILFIKYRNLKITSAVILTMFSEAFITLGIAALIKWNLDAPSLAGIIAGMGTGVNDQIVILSESESELGISLKEKIKRAFFIIIGALFTIFAAMLPLFWAGAGMLKGFALTTLIGVTIGILVTRPAFAEILKIIKK